MGRKKARKTRLTGSITAAEKEIARFRHIDLQRACISRGMLFEMIGEGVGTLQSWFLKHYDNDINTDLLDEFDDWRQGIMKGRGTLEEGFIRLGFIQERDEDGKIKKRKRPRLIKKKKKKRSRNKELNMFSGTKKELTFLSQRGSKTLEETIDIVTKEFPDAKEKSIRIWYKRSMKSEGKEE